METIVLASASPRRFELLSKFGFDIKVLTSDVDEIIGESEAPFEIVTRLAKSKALSVAEQIDYPTLVIAADTIVYLNGNILGKPLDKNDAFNMLKLLSNNTHQVYTGFCVIDTNTKKITLDYEVTDVFFRLISDDEIWSYINTNEPMDKAGAYGIQGLASAFVSRIEGDYFNVVGLPVCKLLSCLKNDFKKEIIINGKPHKGYRN